MISKQKGLPLVGLTAHEPVEVLKPHSAGPLIEWSGQAVEVGRSVMVFAKPARRITIVTQDPANGRFVPGNDAIVARVTGSHLRDHAKAHRVVISAADQGRACRRAERG